MIGASKDRALDSTPAPLGTTGLNADGSLETHQYSVTSHKRNLGGGSDQAEGHKDQTKGSLKQAAENVKDAFK